MGWVSALISAAGSLAGGALGSSGAKSAAKKQAQAAQQQLALQRGIYNSQIQGSEPFRATGLGANNLLAQLYGLPYMDYSPTPGIGGAGDTSGYGSTGVTSKKVGGGGYLSWDRMPGGGGRTAKWNPGDGSAFTTKQVKNLIRRGMSVEDIAQLGRLETTLSPKRLNSLIKKGLSPEDIKSLQYGSAGTPAQQEAERMAGYHEGTGQGDLSVFQNSPGYNFRLNEGLRSVQNSAAARGGLGSGNSLRAVNDYAQGTASDDFYNFVNQMNNMSGRGQTAVQDQQTAGAQYGMMAGNALGNLGDARASGVMGSANSWGNAISGAGGALSDWWSNRSPSGSQGYPYAYGGDGGPPILNQYPPVSINSGPLNIPAAPQYRF